MRFFCSLVLIVSLLAGSLGAKTCTAAPRAGIEWDKTSLTLVTHGNYGRITRLKGGKLMCVYERARHVQARQSTNGGKTWGQEVEVATSPLGSLANPEILQTRSGAIFVFSNLRPISNQNPAPPFAICVSRSLDGGKTFGAVQTIFQAGTRGDIGCWEPAPLQLPSGELQVYFADESPFPDTDEQQISMMRSFDEGAHWSTPEKVSFRVGHRDGMPVPTLLSNGDTAFAIEDNGLSGTFKPSIVRTTKQDNWKSGTVIPDSPNRWGALQIPLDARVYAGAPYLRVLPSGQTVLSFQQADDGDMNHSHLAVCLGDQQARHFEAATRPFSAFKTSAQLWNSLFVKDRDTLLAVTSTKIGDIFGVWTIEGHLKS